MGISATVFCSSLSFVRAMSVFAIAGVLADGQQPTTVLHGTIFDPAGALLPAIAVEVSSAEHTCNTDTGATGKFTCQLPPGRYRISIASQGLMPYRRASVNLQASSHVFLNLRPVLRGIPIGVDGVGSFQTALQDPKISYEEQPIGADADVLIQYSSSNRRGNEVGLSRSKSRSNI